MGNLTPETLRALSEQSLGKRHIPLGHLRSGDAAAAPFGHVQLASLVSSGDLDRLTGAVAVLADMAQLQARVRKLGGQLRDPLKSDRMLKRAEHGIFEAVQTALQPTSLHRTFDDFRSAVLSHAEALATARLEDKFRLTGTEVAVHYDPRELMPLQDGEDQRALTLNLKCSPHRWGVEDALSPMSTNGTFLETVEVRLERLRGAAVAAFIHPRQGTSQGPHALTPANEEWGAHAPLHLLELAGLTQSEALGLKSRQIFLGGMDPTSDAALTQYPQLFGQDHLQRIRDVGAALRRIGVRLQDVSLAYHYGDNPESEALRKLLAKYPEGVVLATKEDMALDSRMRQAWLGEHKRPLLQARHDYLVDPQETDPEVAARKTQVFVRQWVQPNSDWSAEDALAELRERANFGPVRIRPIFKGERMTVMVKVVGDRTLEFGYSAPRGDQQGEFEEIRRILLAHGVPTAVEPVEVPAA